MIVLGSAIDIVKQAVDVLDGSAPNAAAGAFKQKQLNTKGAFFQVAANALNDLAEHKNEAALFEQTDEFGGAIGENDGQFYINLSLRAESEEVAQNIKKMLEGLVAFLSLAGNEQAALVELAANLKLDNVDRAVTINLESDSEAVFAFLKNLWQTQKNK